MPDFFFPRHVDAYDLHSFPTRRSSDLVELDVLELDAEVLGDGLAAGEDREVLQHGLAAVAVARRLHGRSEEHTSELQSLTKLVCRLLLEKKNSRAAPFRPKIFLVAGLI